MAVHNMGMNSMWQYNIDDPGLSVDPSFTTVMLRNIPNKYTTKMLLNVLDRRFAKQYDYVYLPVDFVNHCNVGYAFINLRSPEIRIRFYRHFHAQKVKDVLPGFNSKKVLKQVCEVNRAKVQGSRENIRRIKQMSMLMQRLKEHPDWVPLTFDQNGNAIPLDLDASVERYVGPSRPKKLYDMPMYQGIQHQMQQAVAQQAVQQAAQQAAVAAAAQQHQAAAAQQAAAVQQAAAAQQAAVQGAQQAAAAQQAAQQHAGSMSSTMNVMQQLVLQQQAQAAYNVAVASATAAAVSAASSPSDYLPSDYLSPSDFYSNKENSVSSSGSTTASALPQEMAKFGKAATYDWYQHMPLNYQFQ